MSLKPPVSISKGELVLEPMIKPQYTLKQLVAQVAMDNLRHEVETGPAVGNEAW